MRRKKGSYDYLGKSASATDCTGLMPRAPQDPAEEESYESVYPYLPPEADKSDLS